MNVPLLPDGKNYCGCTKPSVFVLQGSDASAESQAFRQSSGYSRRVPHRRAVLAGLGAALLAPLAIPSLCAAAPVTRKVGSSTVTIVSDGTLNVPLSFSLPDVPADEAAALLKTQGLAADGIVQANVTLVQTGGEWVLIDAGAGPKFQQSAGKLSENLEAAGIDPEKIGKVVFTHGHADHLWGAIDDFDDGERFPNASYVISAAEWDFWTDPDTPAKVPDWLKGMAIGSARILKRLEKKIERRKDGDMVAPGLTYLATPGHTPGHMAVLAENGGQRLLIGGDVLSNNAYSFARPDWRVGSDYDRDLAVATRRRLLDMLTADRIALVGFHLAWPGQGMVERAGPAYRFIPS
jgi:glyoxylase-like metal-dependent hydrolase (beta-lactamase superfamily II)